MVNNFQTTGNHKYKKLIDNLIQIAADGLQELYLPEQLEFASKKKMVNNKIILQGRNTRYTLINLIGLHKAESHNIPFQINLKKTLILQIKNAEKYKSVGDIGLLLWASSLISPEDLPRILTKVNFKNILETYKDAKYSYTMELSWFLTGLLFASTFNKKFKNTIEDLPTLMYNKIRSNYGGSGIFRHEGTNTLQGKLRGKVGSFADQVYPIYAFSLYSQQNKNEEALQIAKECALKICEHQGKNGEWMWHYNAETGNIISKYPVYSVHQDAMAPLALYAIQKASGLNFETYIQNGLNWIEHNNCLNVNMIDIKNNAIWRRIAPTNNYRKIKYILSLFGIKTNKDYKKVEILYECWSYHLGWILYSLSGRTGKNASKGNVNSNHNSLKVFNFN